MLSAYAVHNACDNKRWCNPMCTNYNAHIAIHSNSRRQLECTKITNKLISPYSMKSHIKEKVLLQYRKCNAVAYWFFYRFGMQTVKSFWKIANSLCGTIKRQSWETIRMRKWISVMQRHSRLLSAVLKKPASVSRSRIRNLEHDLYRAWNII